MNKVYAMSDIHGNKELFLKAMADIDDSDTIYFLGDAIDRGHDGWEILKTLINRPNTFYIKGNHEDMMVQAILEIETDFISEDYNDAETIWYYNGGYPTYQSYFDDIDGLEIISKVEKLPYELTYVNKNGITIYMTHSGASQIEYGTSMEINNYNKLWNRSHYFSSTYHGPENSIIVHGHTPIPYLIENLSKTSPAYAERWPEGQDITPGALWYCENKKCCIDSGTAFTEILTVLDLDTFEEKIYGEDTNEE